MNTPTTNTEVTKAEDQAPASTGIVKSDTGLATVEGDDWDLGGVCGLNPDDPEFEGCSVCQ